MASTRVVERPGFWQVITPELTRGGLNQVLATHLHGDVERVIADALAPYLDAGLLFRWEVPPGTIPADLGERLVRAGLHRSSARAMARETVEGAPRRLAGVAVERVSDDNLAVFTACMAAGWGMDAAALAPLHAALLAAPGGRQRLFLARCDGAPAAVAAYVALPRSAYLMGGVVLPAFRGRGLYRALVEARLVDAAARGLRVATTLAREHTSAPLLEHMGFTSLAPIAVYANGFD